MPAGTPITRSDASDRNANGGLYTFNVNIYIDTDRVEGSGRRAMLPGRLAEVAPEGAWEKVICLTPRPVDAREELRRLWLEKTRDRLAAASAGAQNQSLHPGLPPARGGAGDPGRGVLPDQGPRLRADGPVPGAALVPGRGGQPVLGLRDRRHRRRPLHQGPAQVAVGGGAGAGRVDGRPAGVRPLRGASGRRARHRPVGAAHPGPRRPARIPAGGGAHRPHAEGRPARPGPAGGARGNGRGVAAPAAVRRCRRRCP